MTDVSILKFLYEHENRDTGYYTNLLKFLIDKYPHPTGGDLKHLQKLLTHLLDEEYISCSSEFVCRNLGETVYKYKSAKWYSDFYNKSDTEVLTLEAAQNRKSIIKTAIDNKDFDTQAKYAGLTKDDGIMALLQPEGRIYYESVIFREQTIRLNESVISTNKFTKVNIGVSIFLALLVAYLQIISHNREQKRDFLQSHKESQDSLLNKQRLEIDTAMNNRLRLIYQSLSDTSIMKVKIEK